MQQESPPVDNKEEAKVSNVKSKQLSQLQPDLTTFEFEFMQDEAQMIYEEQTYLQDEVVEFTQFPTTLGMADMSASQSAKTQQANKFKKEKHAILKY